MKFSIGSTPSPRRRSFCWRVGDKVVIDGRAATLESVEETEPVTDLVTAGVTKVVHT